MPEKITTEETKRLVKKWKKVSNIRAVALEATCYLLPTMLIFSLIRARFGEDIQSRTLIDILVQVVMLALGVGVFVKHIRRIRAFCANLTVQDIEAIETLPSETISQEDVNTIVAFYKRRSKQNTPKELLRASSPDQNDSTLLRAATYSSETSKEEMLRASNTPAE